MKRVKTLARTISRERAARALVGVVDLAARDPLGDLGRGQPVGPGRLAGVGRRGQLGRGRGHLENANPLTRASATTHVHATLWGAGGRSGG